MSRGCRIGALYVMHGMEGKTYVQYVLALRRNIVFYVRLLVTHRACLGVSKRPKSGLPVIVSHTIIVAWHNVGTVGHSFENVFRGVDELTPDNRCESSFRT